MSFSHRQPSLSVFQMYSKHWTLTAELILPSLKPSATSASTRHQKPATRVAATAAVLFWPSSQGLSGLKGIFPFPYPGTVSSQITAKHGLALAWTLITLLGPFFPPGTAELSAHVPPCPQAVPSLSSQHCTSPTSPAPSQHFPLDLHHQPGTKEQHGGAVIGLPMTTSTSAIQGTVFRLLLIAANVWTLQPSWIHSQGTEGNASISGPKFTSLFKARSEPPRFWLLQIPLLWSYEKTFVVGWFPFALDSCQEQQNGPRQNVMWV